MTLVTRNWARTFFLWLSLAVVMTCALGSFGSPVQASSGSAFNAFTSDVALGPTRASAPEPQRKEQTPRAGGSGQAKALPAASILATPPPLAALRSHHETRLPPPVIATAGALGARAPPRP